ncbi:ubiquitin-conjugating enzyme e2 2 [Phtheirospermum japonicum]|uniref:Ubiquitin-conjugating enzyme e2 2 n=1 Tax=Phtheirospermum japonicum TaxID=374723 RepID=A0A830CVM1_9LAMI|nr:ubiquitin-conjugating enzyme e2 2 [Phtheirospermum japonicum]
MQMEVFAWIFYRISGVRYMMWLLYLHLSSRCSVTRTRIHQQTLKLLVCSVRTNENTTGKCVKLSSRVGQHNNLSI